MNRAQRRAAAKKHGRTRYTPPKDAAPRVTVQHIAPDGTVVKTETVRGVPAEPTEEQLAEQERQRRLASAVAHGLWVPGLPV